MTYAEIDRTLKTMVVLVDTREQDNERARERLAAIQERFPIERQKLDFGDYSALFVMPDGTPFRLNVAIERKMDLGELAQCFCKGRARFQREFERAKEAGAKMYLLCENTSWEKAYSGRYRSQMSPRSLVASILSFAARYYVIFTPVGNTDTTPQLIIDILLKEGKVALERLAERSEEGEH